MDTALITLTPQALAAQTQWIADRDAMVTTAKTVTAVATPADLETAGHLHARMVRHRKALAAARKAVTDPARAWIDDIMTQEKAMGAELDAEAARIKGALDAYATAEAARIEAIRREEERKRREAESAAAKAEQEARSKAAEASRQAGAAERARLEAEEAKRREEAAARQAEAEAQARAKAAAAPKAPSTTANRMVTRWSFTVVNERLVPRPYCVPDEGRIRRYMQFETGQGNTPEMPGVEFVKTVSVEGRG